MSAPPELETLLAPETVQAWRRLSAAPSASVFQGWETAACWWRHFGQGRAAVVHTIADEGGEALCPMVATPYAVGPARVSVLEFMGAAPAERRFSARTFGHSDINRVLGADAALSPACAAALQEIPGWHIARLRNLPGTAAGFLRAWERGRGPFPGRAVQREATLAVSLEGTWGAFMDARTSGFRKRIGYLDRRLRREGVTWSLEVPAPEQAAGCLARALEVEARSWKAGAGTSLYADPRVRAFHLDLARALAARGRVLFAFLLRDGEPLAYEYSYVKDGTLYQYSCGFDAAYERLSPGVALKARVLEWAFERGFERYDMLRGREPYKLLWATHAEPQFELAMSRGPAAALLLRSAEAVQSVRTRVGRGRRTLLARLPARRGRAEAAA
ncbi:MAG TPA: GNAT family N-acetyltransferase [Longimicrobium sp.]